MISESRIEVRYAETDMMGIVYHANYLVWFEIGRTAFLEDIGCPYIEYERRGLQSPVVKAEVEYLLPIHYGEAVIVSTRLVTTTAVRSVFAYEVYREGDETRTVHCKGKTMHCFVESGSMKPVSMKRAAPDLYDAYRMVLTEE